MKKLLLLLMALIFTTTSCTKAPGKTDATLKLKLSGVVNIASGIGAGGAILFGKNSQGESFGKILTGAEENLELTNGNWSFYAVMWEPVAGFPLQKMNGIVHCGKSFSVLNGTDISIPLNLSNAACADPDFSQGKYYVDAVTAKNRFADVFVEECDEVDGTTPFSCGMKNQGSAISYRMVLSSFTKTPNGALNFDNANSIVSACSTVNDLYSEGLLANFPKGNGAAPFIVTLEFFLSAADCNVGDPKRLYKLVLNQGLGVPTSANHRILESATRCNLAPGDFSGTDEENKIKCDAFFGNWDDTTLTCSGAYQTVAKRFFPGPCASFPADNSAIKHQVMIPKSFLCGPYINNSTLTGAHPFAGGDGDALRPYKICTEWQMNQIGEMNSTLSNSAHYKLMNDLDMNKTDFGPYDKPSCVGVLSSIVKVRHNFNPIGGAFVSSDCTSVATVSNYLGVFNGNGKTIKNIRMNFKDEDSVLASVTHLGFVRSLAGKVIDLNFENIDIEGGGTLGGVAGEATFASSTAPRITDVTIENAHIKGKLSNVGGIAGRIDSLSKISNVKAIDMSIRGTDLVGGLVGFSQGTILKSMFRGVVKSDDFSANTTVGGILGRAIATSNVKETFSEGVINTATQFAGGIAGDNAGVIENCYSNMYIRSRYMGSNVTIGGIAGQNTNSSIRYIYSDAIIDRVGTGTTPNLDGVVAYGTAPTNTADCYGKSLLTFSNCTLQSYAQLRTGTIALPGGTWKANVAGSLPRLLWEFDNGSRVCLDASNSANLATQASAGRGGIGDPYTICTSTQLKQLSSQGDGTYFSLKEDINISDWIPGDMLLSFGGVFNGNDYALYGLDLNSSTASSNGIFSTTTSTSLIKNLKLVGNKIINTGTAPTGILTGTNAGTILNVELVGNFVDGVDDVGAVSGTSTGTISDIKVNEALVRGETRVGGVVGNNGIGGVVKKVRSGAHVMNLAAYPNYFKFGGIAGVNNATIDQVSFSGLMEFSITSSSTPVNIGGIVGVNEIGATLTNAMTENYSKVKVKNADKVGGLVGWNDGGSISKAFTLGGLIYDNGGVDVTGGSEFHQLIGDDDGSVNYLFYLENQAGAFKGTAQSTGSACSGSDIIFSTNPSFLTTTPNANLIANSFMGTGGSLYNHLAYTVSVDYIATASSTICANNTSYNFMKMFEPHIIGKLDTSDFSDDSIFSNYDLAYDSGSTGTSYKLDRLFEYFLAKMDNRTPTLTPPIWELGPNDNHPVLIQIDHD